ncbi:FtsW/RodA/SpoVE family cell cycle protein [Zafaria sp. Z1313]|uniref:FtsW/RodA/SpoVE family cell cycle protein n=1 Tax=unclassified Zafaria TaxID=2828765 RepID=UPI002E7A780C|nr:FtsW/RodA/SpoVE family cell cycle protein [Zafaria sp. J156]MEE1621468.1 FtsW/RodA/SpoVE family cell cycle protein [Zafaria sp. J156]
MTDVQTAPVSRRNTELWLLVLALGVAVGANYLASATNPAGPDPDFVQQGAVLAGLALAVHIVLRIWAKYADPIILPCVVALNGIGIAMIHRLDLTTGDSAATRQLLWTGVAMAAAIITLWALRDHRVLRRATYIFLLASGVLLLLPLVPGLGAEINGARIWVRMGPLSFQPGELAKITLSIFFAGYLSNNRDLILLAGRKFGPLQLPRARDLGPMVVAWLISIGVLVFQRDLGSSILFFGLFMVMIYVATARISWIVIGLGMVAVGGVLAARFMGHVTRRIDAWVNAFDPEVINRQGGSGQIVQGLFGLANGGLFGSGIGGGRPDLVPYANSDMIVAALGEELGLIGITAIILLYVLLVSRGIRAALGTRDAFGKLLAAGLSFTIGLQCFVVMGGITRLIPLTGLTTPFVAAGGSSLLSNWIIVALLLLVSNNARRPAAVGPLTDLEVATTAPSGEGGGRRGRPAGRTPKRAAPGTRDAEGGTA